MCRWRAVIDHHHRVVALGELADRVQLHQVAVHREHPVGGDQAAPVALGLLQNLLELGHVRVGIAEALGLAQSHAVDDRGVVELVGDDGVALAQDGLEEPSVGVEAGRVEDGVVGAVEARDRSLELLVQVLGAADEAHRGHPEAAHLERLLGGGDDLRVVRQAEVVVGAEVDDLALGHPDRRALR
jgi:hypothetical protein